MSNHVLVSSCNDCDSLKQAYDEVECTLIDQMRNKANNDSYNTNSYYSQPLVNRLRRYRSFISKRLHNPRYAGKIQNQDILTLVNHYAYKDCKCSDCAPCFPPLPAPSTTTTSTTTSTTTTTTSTSTTTLIG